MSTEERCGSHQKLPGGQDSSSTPGLGPQASHELAGSGKTALHQAAARGLLKHATAIVSTTQGREALHTQDADGLTPLHAAAKGGHADVLASPSPASLVNLQSDKGSTALMWGAHEGHVGVVEALLKVPECQLGIHNKGQNTALQLAARQGHTQMVQRLLAALKPGNMDAALRNRDGGGQTPLWTAVQDGRTDIIGLLPQKPHGPATICITDHSGLTPLHAAACGGHAAVVAQLLQASPSAAAIINLQTNTGYTACIWAAQEGHVAAVHELLRVPECQLGIQDMDGDSTLKLAARMGHAGVVQRLLQALEGDAAALSSRDAGCRTPL